MRTARSLEAAFLALAIVLCESFGIASAQSSAPAMPAVRSDPGVLMMQQSAERLRQNAKDLEARAAAEKDAQRKSAMQQAAQRMRDQADRVEQQASQGAGASGAPAGAAQPPPTGTAAAAQSSAASTPPPAPSPSPSTAPLTPSVPALTPPVPLPTPSSPVPNPPVSGAQDSTTAAVDNTDGFPPFFLARWASHFMGPQCQEGHTRSLGQNVTVRAFQVCTGPYYTMDQGRAIFLHFPRARTLDFFDGGISADIAGPKGYATTDAGRKPVPAGLCPALTSSKSDSTANDPRLVCDCTEAYLRQIAGEATQFLADHPGKPALAPYLPIAVSIEESYERIAWAGLMRTADKPPGWKWRCDLLDQKPDSGSLSTDTTAEPARPVLRPDESPAEYAAEMRAYGQKMRDHMIASLQATRDANTRNANYARRVGEIPDVAYLSVIGAQISLWDIEETVFSSMALQGANEFLRTVDQAELVLWTAQAQAVDFIGVEHDSDNRLVLDLSAFLAEVEKACPIYDRAADQAIEVAASSTRMLASNVRDAHDRLLREIKMWAAFAGRDGFPSSARAYPNEASGGFLGLEHLLFDNPTSLALHPEFAAPLRPRDFSSYLGFSFGGVDLTPGTLRTIAHYWEANTSCRDLHFASLPLDFDVDIGGMSPSTTAFTTALPQLAENASAAIWLRLDVLKANNFIELFASGADPSESP